MTDSKDRIARSNIYSDFGRLLKSIIKDNHDGEVILKKAGLSAFVEDYENILRPYVSNRGYENPNEQYNPEYACIAICEEIENNEEDLIRFMNTILEQIYEIDERQFHKLASYLGVIGYELLELDEVDMYGEVKRYSLCASTDGVKERNADMSYLQTLLSTHHFDLSKLYDEALSTFGLGQYKSCIDNCRSLFESFFKKIDKHNYCKGILDATGEIITQNGSQLTSKNKIFRYWFEKNEGANRFRLFYTLYSAMSGLGTHCEEIATKEDALLLLRYTEDCLLWCFRKGINI